MGSKRRGRGHGTMRERRPGVWQLRLVDGGTVITRTVEGDERAADLALAQLRIDAAHGIIPETRTERLTVAQLLERWYDSHHSTLSPTTADGYRGSIDRYVTGTKLAAMPLGDLKMAHLDGFYAHLSARGGKDGKPLSASTVKQVHAVLHRALKQAVRWEMIPINPAENCTLPRKVHAELHPPGSDELRRAIDVVKTDPTRFAFLRLALVTGCRRGELVGLQWQDFDGLALTVSRAVVHQRARDDTPGRLVVKGTKTGRQKRMALDPLTAAAVGVHRNVVLDLAERSGVSLRPESFVFSTAVDGSAPWRPDAVTKMWETIRDEAGLPTVRLHDLRHAMVTVLLAAGVDVKTAATRAGHHQSAMTLDVYGHAIPANDVAAAMILANEFG